MACASRPAAFTNLTRDHLDYHPSFEDYFDAKMRLFEELLPPGAPAVINVDTPHGAEVDAALPRAGAERLHRGQSRATGLRLIRSERDGFGQRLEMPGPGPAPCRADLPLVGDFQVSNALVAAGLVVATGGEEVARHALRCESLKGAKGRLELVARASSGAPVFVDYAHKPDALDNALHRSGPMSPDGWPSSSAAAATATGASARRWARSPRGWRTASM